MNRRRLLRGIVFVGVFALAMGVSPAQALVTYITALPMGLVWLLR